MDVSYWTISLDLCDVRAHGLRGAVDGISRCVYASCEHVLAFGLIGSIGLVVFDRPSAGIPANASVRIRK